MLILLFLVGCGPKSEHSTGVKLVLSTEQIGPTTTFELRFDQPIIKGGLVGTEAKPSPLIFSPSVRGHFVYTSARSGVFTPDEPLSLGVEYLLRLRPELTRPDGQPLKAELFQRVQTPPFGVANWEGPGSSTNAYSEPVFYIWFNADVKAADVAFHASFTSPDGLRTSADVRQGTEEDRNTYWWGGSPFRTWSESFEQARREPGLRRARKLTENGTPTNDVPNLLVVSPAEPLAVGHGWKLVIEPGFTSADGRWYAPKPFESPIGDVQPFLLTEEEMHHVINRAPRLQLDFSKKLDLALTNTFTNWIQISPQPANLTADVFGATMSLSGDWLRRTNYQVTVNKGFPAAEAFALSAPETFELEVPPIESRLYFPAFATEQLASGRRAFPLLAVNVEHVRVRAKLLEPGAVIHALRGYSGYFPAQKWPAVKDGYRRLDYNLVPGRTVYNAELPANTQEDAAQEVPLDWDKLLEGRKTGVVFVEAERLPADPTDEGRLGTQALVQLTDLGMVWKAGDTDMKVFVFSYTTGEPKSGVRLQLRSDENEPLREAVTDGSGVASFNVQTNGEWLVAERDGDVHALKAREYNVQAYTFGVPIQWDHSQTANPHRVALFTDRDVYRPGETVNLKAVVRDLTDLGVRIPDGLKATAQCLDARGKPFFETNVVLNDLGSCAVSIPLPSGPRGTYQLALMLDHEYSHPVTVADYQPAAFEIALPAKPEYGPTEAIRLPVSARYLFGKSLSKARVRWSLEAEDHPLDPKGFERFSFFRSLMESQWGRGSGVFSSTGEGQIGKERSCVITAQVPLNPAAPQPRLVSVLAEVTDLNQQTLTHSVNFLKHSSDFYLGIKRLDQVIEPGHELPLEIAAVGANGKPWPAPVSVHLSLERVVWETTRVQGAGRSVRYQSQASLTNLVERDLVVAQPELPAQPNDEATGFHVKGISAPEAGAYQVEVKAVDAAGHEVASSALFYVTDRAKLAWNYRNEIEIKLVPDKPLYHPGETALVLVKTPLSGTAWVTVECDKVLRSFAATLEGNAPSVRVPIQASDAPNVFVSVTLLRGAVASTHRSKEPEYRMGYCQLNVEDPDTQLHVEVSAGATNYLPGDRVHAEARIANASGEPVSGAEVTLYAVDEGVLTLTDYVVPNLHDLLFEHRLLAVNSGISLPSLLPEDPQQLTFQNKGYLGGGGGRERLRQRFLACAFWNASLRTGPDGRVQAEFTAPDSLTRYRLIGVAHAARQFGSGQSAFSISKPLMIEPALPRFANLTDRLQARAVVLNQTEQAAEVSITLQLDDKAKALEPAKLSQRIPIAAHGSATVEVPVTFVDTGTTAWNWRARFVEGSGSPSFSDGVRSTLEVGTLMPLLREVTLVRVEPGETNLVTSINPQLLSGQGAITLTLANTRMVELGEAISELLHYPYGCAEQTGSSLWPWVLLQSTPELIAFTGKESSEAAIAAQASIKRLFSMQTESGGLAYWPGGHEPMLWASAYGGFVLAQARATGLPVPEEEFKALLEYLSGELRSYSGNAAELGDRCLAACALAFAGRNEPAYHEKLFEARARLSKQNRALLAFAIAKSTGRNPMTDALLQTNSSSPEEESPFECLASAAAIRLLALLASEPGAPSAEARQAFAALEQIQQRTPWMTTQGHAWTLLAMREYLHRTEVGLPSGDGNLRWGGETIPFQVGVNHGVFTHQFQLNPPQPDQPLLLTSTSPQPLFAQLKVESRSQATNQVQEDHGLRLLRQYQRLSDNNEPEAFNMLEVGDRVLITLHLTLPQKADYVVVDDPLPSLFEAVNPEFKTQQLTAGTVPAWMQQDAGDDWWSDFWEMRTDRVLFFANHVEPGSYTIRYVARVRAAGTATAPPAKAEEMYHPDRFGLTATQAIASQAGE